MVGLSGTVQSVLCRQWQHDCCIESEGNVCTFQVIINGLGDAYNRNAVLIKTRSYTQSPVAPDADQQSSSSFFDIGYCDLRDILEFQVTVFANA
jgi:hypothetical protein